MANLSIAVDKDNTFKLADQLSAADKAELIKKLQEPGSGAAVTAETSKGADEYLKLIRDTHDYGEAEFDKNILYVSSSALGLTFAFIEKTVPLLHAKSKLNLWTGWLLLGITILLYVISQLISSFYQDQLIKKVDAAEKAGSRDVRNDAAVERQRKKGNRVITAINVLLYALMTAGIVFIMVFIYQNL